MPEHYKENRPWGSYEILSQFKTVGQGLYDTCVKILTLRPGGSLSYQSHKQRNEFWVVVQGRGALRLNDQDSKVAAGSVIQIPIGARHRVRNTDDKLDLIIIESQTGHYDEQDIERYEDDYGRA